MTVCWVVHNLNPYFVARLGAFAKRQATRPCLIEWTNRSELSTLEVNGLHETSFARHTLFAGIELTQIDSRTAQATLWKALDRLKPGAVCVNGWGLFGSLSTLSWCLRTGIPAVLMSESSAHDAPRWWWREAVKARIANCFNSALVGGTDHRDYLEALGFERSRIFVGYDVVDNAHFATGADAARNREAETRRRTGIEGNYFLACSRFSEKKNLLRLIDAYSIYRRAQVDDPWRLVILGDGPLRQALELRRKELGLERDVLMPGAASYQELPLYYGLAEAFVHASTSEQWGLVVNEAMASGLPILVSERCGCARDLVASGNNGYTFSPYSLEDIAASLAKLASPSCDRKAMAQASRRRIADWAPTKFAEGLSQAIAAAQSGSRKRPVAARLVVLADR